MTVSSKTQWARSLKWLDCLGDTYQQHWVMTMNELCSKQMQILHVIALWKKHQSYAVVESNSMYTLHTCKHTLVCIHVRYVPTLVTTWFTQKTISSITDDSICFGTWFVCPDSTSCTTKPLFIMLVITWCVVLFATVVARRVVIISVATVVFILAFPLFSSSWRFLLVCTILFGLVLTWFFFPWLNFWLLHVSFLWWCYIFEVFCAC